MPSRPKLNTAIANAKASDVDDIDCPHCNDTGFITLRTTFPMTYVCAGSPPDDAKDVVEVPCDRCNPIARWAEECEEE